MQREDVAISGQSAMAITGQILLSAHTRPPGAPKRPGPDPDLCKRARPRRRSHGCPVSGLLRPVPAGTARFTLPFVRNRFYR
jgi:hypothetical protein